MNLSEMLLSWRVAPDVGPDHVSQLFKKARIWCKQQTVTGVLVYDGECLMGHFEAPQSALLRMHEAYRTDDRHVEVRLQHVQRIVTRNYPAFRAGYMLEDAVTDEPDSSLASLLGLAGNQAKMAFRQLQPELD